MEYVVRTIEIITEDTINILVNEMRKKYEGEKDQN
jgi:hypothetical protein